MATMPTQPVSPSARRVSTVADRPQVEGGIAPSRVNARLVPETIMMSATICLSYGRNSDEHWEGSDRAHFFSLDRHPSRPARDGRGAGSAVAVFRRSGPERSLGLGTLRGSGRGQ